MVSINGNVAAGLAQANIGKASTSASASIARLSSGNRIAQASDDVAGLSVGTALRTQVSTLKQALANAGQGTSLLQVADGALSQLVDIVTRQKAIATQASSGQLDDTARGYLNQEFQALAAQVDQISSSTNFNGVKLLNGGLGTTTILANTDALAASFTPTTAAWSTGQTAVSTPANSTKAVQAFNTQTGVLNSFAANANAGNLDIVDSGGTVLANGAFDTINGALFGKFSNFKISNVVYGASALITATINGVDFTGTYTSGVTNVQLNNGSTYIKLGVGIAAGAAAALSLADAGAVQNSQNGLNNVFANTSIARVQVVSGVDFAGTRLAGAIGTAANGGVAMARLYSPTAVINNFEYAGNTGAANTSRLTVSINGQTFTANNVEDVIDTTNGGIVFTSSDSQVFRIDLAGLAPAFTNIRTNAQEQQQFIAALNSGFAKAGAGLSFAVGSAPTDTVNISLASTTTSSIYGGQAVDVGTAAGAQAAAPAIDKALELLTASRATVGAFESRFNFISSNLQTSIQNQDASRGVLLDTDVSSESTAFATAQVQLQAGIAVLAQANQLPQNLLKLIQ
jgi:flagellin